MKFFPPTADPVSIGLTSGHMALVTEEGSELDAMFHREAIARGCTPEGIAKPKEPEPATGFNRASTIKLAINAMLDGKDAADFKKDGTPDLRMVTKRVGFTVQRDEVEAIWAELQAETE